jgi:nucleoside-diphosphate-sugar epimerase
MSHGIAITGATGFIGSALAAELLRRGDQVTILTRAESSLSRLSSLDGYHRVTYAQLSDPQLVAALKDLGIDILIHCAWRGVGGQDRNEAFQLQYNVPAALASVELAASAGCRQWIGLGSQAEYGNQNRRLSEDAPLQPTTLYGKAKLAAGQENLALCRAKGMAGAWVRVFSTYGPGDAPNWFIPYVIREFLANRPPQLTSCEQLWDYLYVGDAGRALASLADAKTQGIFNLGSGSARPLRDYIEAIRQEFDESLEPVYGAIPYRLDQVMHLEADISRLSAATGWTPQVSMEEGIRATVAFERTRTL